MELVGGSVVVFVSHVTPFSRTFSRRVDIVPAAFAARCARGSISAVKQQVLVSVVLNITLKYSQTSLEIVV